MENSDVVHALEFYFAEHPDAEFRSVDLAEELGISLSELFAPLHSFEASGHLVSRRDPLVVWTLTPRGHEFAKEQCEARRAAFLIEQDAEAEKERRKLRRGKA